MHELTLKDRPSKFVRAQVHQAVCSCGWKTDWYLGMNDPQRLFQRHREGLEESELIIIHPTRNSRPAYVELTTEEQLVRNIRDRYYEE